MKKTTRLLSLLLALTLLVGMAPVLSLQAKAANTSVTADLTKLANATYGTNATFTINGVNFKVTKGTIKRSTGWINTTGDATVVVTPPTMSGFEFKNITCSDGTAEGTTVIFNNDSRRSSVLSGLSVVLYYHSHDLASVPEDPATCTMQGHKAYQYCKDETCGKKFIDGVEVTDADLVIPASHSLTDVGETAATCTTDGVKAHKLCTACSKMFVDGVEKTAADLVIPAGHSLTDVGETAATCTTDGVKAHKLCTACNKMFVDGVEKTAAELVIPANGHKDDNKDHKCDICGEDLRTMTVTTPEANNTRTMEVTYGDDTVKVSLNVKNTSIKDPFKVTLDGLNTLKTMLSGLGKDVTCGEFQFWYSATGKNYKQIDPKTFTPKEGYYEVRVNVTFVSRLRALNANNPDTNYTLYAKYTVTNPTTTAATGDSRPIELVMTAMVMFGALAAAAYALDNKGKFLR